MSYIKKTSPVHDFFYSNVILWFNFLKKFIFYIYNHRSTSSYLRVLHFFLCGTLFFFAFMPWVQYEVHFLGENPSINFLPSSSRIFFILPIFLLIFPLFLKSIIRHFLFFISMGGIFLLGIVSYNSPVLHTQLQANFQFSVYPYIYFSVCMVLTFLAFFSLREASHLFYRIYDLLVGKQTIEGKAYKKKLRSLFQ